MAKSNKDLLADAKAAREKGESLPNGVVYRSYIYPHFFKVRADGELVPLTDDDPTPVAGATGSDPAVDVLSSTEPDVPVRKESK